MPTCNQLGLENTKISTEYICPKISLNNDGILPAPKVLFSCIRHHRNVHHSLISEVVATKSLGFSNSPPSSFGRLFQ